MTAPALYRYFPGLAELVEALTVDLYDELVTAMETARDAEEGSPVFARMLAASRAFRAWAVSHPPEFALLFATPPASFGHPTGTPCDEASSRFGNVFAELFLEIWRTHPFPVDDDVEPYLAANLLPYWTWLTSERMADIPMAAVVVFLEGWIRLYGTVAMEVFGHLQWAVPDGEAMFEQTLCAMARSVHAQQWYKLPRRA